MVLNSITVFIQKQWKNVARSVGSEVINIGLTAFSGFVMIQHLSKESYGVYGFIITAVNLIISLSEVGINHCFLPLVGYKNVSNDRVEAVAILFKQKRIRLLYISISVVILPTFWLLYEKNWLSATYTVSILLMLFGGVCAVNEQLKRQKFTALHNSKLIARSNSISSISRTIWILLSLYFVPQKWVIIFLSCNGAVGSLIGIWIYKSKEEISKAAIAYYQQNINSLQASFKKIYLPLRLPAFLYVLYASFGGIVIGWFGNTNTMANVNAAGRLGMCLVLVDKVVGIFIIPKLAQASSAIRYIKLLKNSLLVYLFFVSLIVISAWLLPQAWLLLIGQKYSDLQEILWLCFLGVVLSNFTGFIFTCMTARGFTANQLPIFFAAITVQFISIYFLGMYTAKSVFLINIITSSVFALGNGLLLIIRVNRLRAVEIV